MIENKLHSINKNHFKNLFYCGPVGCIKIIKNYVLTGHGPFLKIFKINKSTHSLIFNQKIFDKNNIHVIELSLSLDIVFIGGGDSFNIFRFDDLISNKKVNREFQISEWIISSAFQNDKTFLVLDFHNNVYQIEFTYFNNEFELELKTKKQCKTKSLLYSGTIKLMNDEKIIIACGTILNSILLWDFDTEEIINIFKYHNGSIFDIKFSFSGKFFATCSDDRSIVLYDFINQKKIAVGWGHNSRIWNLNFFKMNDENIKILSVGEDCTARIWTFLPNQTLLKQIAIFENCHSGKNIWSSDLDNTNLNLFVTGGADGSIKLHDLNFNHHIQHEINSLTLKNDNSLLQKDETIKCFFLIKKKKNVLIFSTSKNNLYCFNYNENKLTKLNYQESVGFGRILMIKGLVNHNLIFLLFENGSLKILKLENFNKLKIFEMDHFFDDKKLNNIFVDFNDIKNVFHLLLIYNHKITLYFVYTFCFNEEKIQSLGLKQLLHPKLNKFTIKCVAFDSLNNWIILGSKYSDILVYNLNNIDKELKPFFFRLPKDYGISSIKILQKKKNNLVVLIIMKSTYYMYLSINCQTYEILHFNKTLKGFVVDGFQKNNDLILVGFKAKTFFLWNETKQVEIISIDCGGVNAKWLFQESFDYQWLFDFVFLKNSSLFLICSKERFLNNGILNEGIHGKEIRSVDISEEFYHDSFHIMLTASEDTSIKICKLYSNGTIKVVWTIKKHVSGLQKIKFINNNYFASCAAKDEFIVWKLLFDSNNTPFVSEFFNLKPTTFEMSLRIMDFDFFKFDSGFIFSTVYSNSNIKVWYLNIIKKQSFIFIDDFYSICCILNVKFLFFEERIFLLITATNGYISIWEITDHIYNNDFLSKSKLNDSIVCKKLHQNGIKSLYVQKNTNFYTIITGSDDSSLTLSKLIYDNAKIQYELLYKYQNASTSTITSIMKINNDSVIVTSLDQIVRVWTHKNNDLKCISAKNVEIADIGCVATKKIQNDLFIIICGLGLCVWKYKFI